MAVGARVWVEAQTQTTGHPPGALARLQNIILVPRRKPGSRDLGCTAGARVCHACHMSVSERQRREAITAMLMAETSCRESDLTDGLVHIVEKRQESRDLPAHRRFMAHPGTMCVVTLGTGAVVAADGEHIRWARTAYSGQDRDGVFDPVRTGEAARYWAQFGRKVFGPFPRFSGSSETVQRCKTPAGYRVAVKGEEILPKLGKTAWPHATPSSHPARPMVFAAVAYAGTNRDDFAGVASVTADSDFMWQIGIDVAPGHQGKGVGAAIASRAALEVLSQGRVPYWGATNSNVPSIRTALAAGLLPTYVEVLSRPVQKA
jgi:GNAT superfamily N-acetyltransferase